MSYTKVAWWNKTWWKPPIIVRPPQIVPSKGVAFKGPSETPPAQGLVCTEEEMDKDLES